jgi:hypothetical protein
MTLTSADFPLITIGATVYGRQMSPIFTATSDQLAADLANRLNREEMARWGGGGYRSTGGLVYG